MDLWGSVGICVPPLNVATLKNSPFPDFPMDGKVLLA